MDKVVHNANSEISNLRTKVSSMVILWYQLCCADCPKDMSLDQDTLIRKNEELVQAFREKSRKQLQTQELYDKLKRRTMLGQVQTAASDAVNHTIQASVTANRFVDRVGDQTPQAPQASIFTGLQSSGIQVPGILNATGTSMPLPAGRNGTGDGTWAGFGSQGSNQRRHF